MVAVSPGLAAVVFRMTTPSGLVAESDAEVMVSGVDRLRIFPGRGVILNRHLGRHLR